MLAGCIAASQPARADIAQRPQKSKASPCNPNHDTIDQSAKETSTTTRIADLSYRGSREGIGLSDIAKDGDVRDFLPTNRNDGDRSVVCEYTRFREKGFGKGLRTASGSDHAGGYRRLLTRSLCRRAEAAFQ